MTTQNNLASAVVDSNESAKNGNHVFSIRNGGIALNVQPDGPFDSLENFGSAFLDLKKEQRDFNLDTTINVGKGVVGAVKGIPRGIFNFAEEFNRTLLPGYNENVVPWMNENIPGLKELNDFTANMLEYDNKAQTIGGQYIGEPVGEFVVPGATVSRGAQVMGMANKFLANVLGYGATEAIAVPAEEQAMISMGLDLTLPNSEIKSLILEGLQADEDAAYIIQKLQKAPENFLGGGYLGEKLDQAISGIGTLYTRIKNSPKLNEMKNNVTESLIKAGDDAQARIDENKGSTQLNMGMDPTDLTDQGLALIGNVLKKNKKEAKPRDESSGHASDSVPAQFGPPAHDMNMKIEEEFTPDGFSPMSTDMGENYENLKYFISSRRGTPEYNEEVAFYRKLFQIKGNPNAEITIYRASPTDDLRYGDLITPIKSDAEFHVEQSKVTRKDIVEEERKIRLQSDEPVDLKKEKMFRGIDSLMELFPENNTPSKLYTYKVKAKDIRWDGNNGLIRWGYFPEGKIETLFKGDAVSKISLDDIKKKYPNVDLSINENNKGLTLSKIVVPEGTRSEGVGSNVMKDIIKYADKNNLPIGVTPDTTFGGSKTRLERFYKKFGFVRNKGRNKDFNFRETFVRQPKAGGSQPSEVGG